MINKGKHKCALCGCIDDCRYIEETDGKKKKYYCSPVCFRIAHPKQALWGKKTCESCGMHMSYSSRPMFEYDHVNDKPLFFCCEDCYAYYFGMLDESSYNYAFVDKRNRQFVKQEKKNDG